MNFFAALLLGHLIGDFPLQTNRIAQAKHQSQAMLVIHVLIHVCVTAALLQNPLNNLPLLLMIGATHYLIDSPHVGAMHSGASRGFLCDQMVHLSTLSAITLITMFSPDTLPINALPTTILYPALAYGLLLGGMVFGWIWANEIALSTTHHMRQIGWMQSRMLLMSQRAGVALLGLIVVALFVK